MYWVTSSAFYILIALSKRVIQGLLENSQGGFTTVPHMTSSPLRELQEWLLSLQHQNTCMLQLLFFLSLDDCMALLAFYLSKEEKKRSGSQSVYLNLLQVLKLKAKYVFKIIYFYKGEQESASALILFLQFQGFEFKLFIQPPCLD